MTHVDLFSGIGGFALAAKANGIRTVQFVEIDNRCRDFLSKAWPGVAIHDDIGTFHWGVANSKTQYGWDQRQDDRNGCKWQGGNEFNAPPEITGTAKNETISRATHPVYLLTAGVPCQPASRAGKQRGATDDRWLWPEALRVLREVAPAWCLFENPPGIGDVGLDGILSGVEAEGYEVEVLSIPACAVNAAHRRERYWIVGKRMADADEPRYERPDAREGRRCNAAHGLCTERAQGNMVDVKGDSGRAGKDEGVYERHDGGKSGYANFWRDYLWLPCADGKVRRAPDDSFGVVDGLHTSLLGALGNSIVPQIAVEIIAAMVQCGHHTGEANEMVREG